MGLRAMATRTIDSLPLRPGILTQSLPADAYTASIHEFSESDRLQRVSRPVQHAAFSYVIPEKAPNPTLITVSRSALTELDIPMDVAQSDEFVQVFSGNKLVAGTRPWALCYAGHQFGFFAGQLGDGRAMSLFETENSRGRRWDVQLKGAGQTPYSRFGDGFAVLRSSIREFLASEHMHALGIPTTRALSLITTSREVYRDDAPSDVKQPERGAIVARMAASWLRFGSFEIFFSRSDMENVRRLADYALREVVNTEEAGETSEKGNQYARLFYRIARKTSRMVAGWQAVGFNHGVMNTDNMSILGLTLDYGPFQFLDFYDPDYICNHSDDTGRYAFKRQPTVCIYNLFKLAVPLFELIGAGDQADTLVFPRNDSSATSSEEQVVTDATTRAHYKERGEAYVTKLLSEQFSTWFMKDLSTRMLAKLGLQHNGGGDDEMENVVIPLLDWMTEYGVDYHLFFRSLAGYKVTSAGELEDEKQAQITISVRDPASLEECKTALSPWIAIYRHHLLLQKNVSNEERQQQMNAANPRFVMRNWIVQEVIEAFDKQPEKEAITILHACLEACTNPYKEHYEDANIERWVTTPVPERGRDLKCSCSS